MYFVPFPQPSCESFESMDNSLGLLRLLSCLNLCFCCPLSLLHAIVARSMTALSLPSSYQVPGLLSHLGITTIPRGNFIFSLNRQMREPKLTKWLALRSARWLAEPRVSAGSLTPEPVLLSMTPCPPPLPSERWIGLYLSYLRQRLVWAQ